MRLPITVIVFILPIYGGCAKQLKVAIERYSYESNPEASTEYARANSSAPVVSHNQYVSQLRAIEVEVDHYQGFVIDYNDVVRAMFDQHPDVTAVKAPFDVFHVKMNEIQDRLLRDKATNIDVIRNDTTNEVQSAWHDLLDALTKAKTRPRLNEMETVLGQMNDKEALKTLAQQAMEKLGHLKSKYPQFIVATNDDSVTLTVLGNRLKSAAIREEAVCQSHIDRLWPDQVHQEFKVTQNLADPFLSYISDHPKLWKPFENGVESNADGDAEFILVFESRLSPRWKSIAVDPSKVIAARLRTARRLAEIAFSAIAAFNGVLPFGSLNSSKGVLPLPSESTDALLAERVRGRHAADQIQRAGAMAASQLVLLGSVDDPEKVEQARVLVLSYLNALPAPTK